jgi:phosphomannomutase
MAVKDLHADGGVVISASHNPGHWNALKLLNSEGEFLSAADGHLLLGLLGDKNHAYAEVNRLGTYHQIQGQLEKHIQSILGLSMVDVGAIRKKAFRIGVDGINSVGGVAVPMLLRALGVVDIMGANLTPDGKFSHDPEPLPKNLSEISRLVSDNHLDAGFVVDPDVDRLAIVMDDGDFFGEEYTLVAVADYILSKQPGNTVSNLSSTHALKVVTEKYGGQYYASAVGEVNVVEMMKKVGAVIGGEGNGGVIYPELHYGRDALAGIALFLSWLAITGKSCSGLRKTYPDYYISKNKIQLEAGAEPEKIINEMAERYKDYPINSLDGLRIEFKGGWVHLRQSNTEPVIRIYAEGKTYMAAENLAQKIMDEVSKIPC